MDVKHVVVYNYQASETDKLLPCFAISCNLSAVLLYLCRLVVELQDPCSAEVVNAVTHKLVLAL